VRNDSISTPQDMLPVESWMWWRGQGLKEKVLELFADGVSTSEKGTDTRRGVLLFSAL